MFIQVGEACTPTSPCWWPLGVSITNYSWKSAQWLKDNRVLIPEPLTIEHATSSPPIYFEGIPNTDSLLMEFDLEIQVKFNSRTEVINLESTNALKSSAQCNVLWVCVSSFFLGRGPSVFISFWEQSSALQVKNYCSQAHPKIWPTKGTNGIYDRGFGNCLFFFQEANVTL